MQEERKIVCYRDNSVEFLEQTLELLATNVPVMFQDEDLYALYRLMRSRLEALCPVPDVPYDWESATVLYRDEGIPSPYIRGLHEKN